MLQMRQVTGAMLLALLVGFTTPAYSQDANDRGTATTDHDDGFDDWGLLGLLGLAGLLGRQRRDRDVPDTRRV